MTVLLYDTETQGLINFKEPHDHPSQPLMVEFAGVLIDDAGKPQSLLHFLVKPEGWTISKEASDIHGITTERALQYGVPLAKGLDMIYEFMELAQEGDVAHNCSFDRKILRIAAHRCGKTAMVDYLRNRPSFCTMLAATPICKIQGPRGLKWPRLNEALLMLCNEQLVDAHTALADAKACMKIYLELKRRGVVKFSTTTEAA